jgi:hypothetical protein
VANHTFSHTSPLGRLGPAESLDEIVKTQELLGDLAPERMFRPYGEGGIVGPHLLSPAACEFLVAEHFTCVLWNAVPRDWERPDGWMDTALAMCRDHEHAVLVLHDVATGAMRHLPGFLDRLLTLGIETTDEFPVTCTPIVAGRRMPGLDQYVMDDAESG